MKRTELSTDTYYYEDEGQKTLHRIGAPAAIFRTQTGEVFFRGWYFHGKQHRILGPALIYDGRKEYWLNGEKLDLGDFLTRLLPFQRRLFLLRLANGRD